MKEIAVYSFSDIPTSAKDKIKQMIGDFMPCLDSPRLKPEEWDGDSEMLDLACTNIHESRAVQKNIAKADRWILLGPC